MGSGRGSGGGDGDRSKGFELSWKHTVLGCLVGMLFGLLMGALMGGPMALSAYGSTKDAIVSGMLRTFSLDQNKTDIPDIQPAMHLEVCPLPSCDRDWFLRAVVVAGKVVPPS